MTLYLTAKTDVKDLIIDFIEVQFKSRETVSLNWKRSWVQRGKSGFCAEYEGVCFNEHLATGQLERLRKMHVKEIGMYSEEHGEGQYSLAIDRMEFYENNKRLVFRKPYKTDKQSQIHSEAMQQLYNKFLASSRR